MSRQGAPRTRVPRALHPAAWWLWAIALAVAASRTTNPLLLLLILGVVGFVVTARRTDAPWARGFRYFLVLALTVVAIRVVLRAVFGGGIGAQDHILVTLPELPMPDWMTGVRLGGPVSSQVTLAALTDGLRLGVLLCCVGAANALANPKRALRLLPPALHEISTAVVVAVTVAPQLVESVQRVHRARRLRAGPAPGLRVLRSVAIPVFEDALERSLRLAAAMDSRGYGGRRAVGARRRRTTATLVLGGLAALCLGLYGLLDGGSPAALGPVATLTGVALTGLGLAVGGRRVSRTTYRPDPWRTAEWLVVGVGALAATVLAGGYGASADQLSPSFAPLAWPQLPVLPTAAVLVAALAGIFAPPVPPSRRAARPVAVPRAQPVRDERPVGVGA